MVYNLAKTTDLVLRQTVISLNVVTELNAICRNYGLTLVS